MRAAGLSVLVIGVVGVAGGAANAQFVTFGFTDLDGSYNQISQQFDATAVDFAPLFSGGDVSLVGLGGGTADYDAGFIGLATSADASFSMIVSPINATTANGSGSFTIVDADGDEYTGGINGTWTDRGNGFAFFDGDIIRALFTDNGQQDNMFDGPSGGGFSLDGLTGTRWYGAISFLMPIPASGFFGGDFDENVTLVDGIVLVPAPASLGLLAVGGLALRRRR